MLSPPTNQPLSSLASSSLVFETYCRLSRVERHIVNIRDVPTAGAGSRTPRRLTRRSNAGASAQKANLLRANRSWEEVADSSGGGGVSRIELELERELA